MSYAGTVVVVLCFRLSEVLAPQEIPPWERSSAEWSVHLCLSTEKWGWSCLSIEQSVCSRLAVGWSVLSVASHVCQQSSVHVCLPTERSLCWYLSWQQGTFMFANHKCVYSCLPREESVCSCLSRQQNGCSCVLFAKRAECVYICLLRGWSVHVCQQISACLCLPREQSVHSCLSKNSVCTCFSREQSSCVSEEQNACLSRECSVCSVLSRYPSLL